MNATKTVLLLLCALGACATDSDGGGAGGGGDGASGDGANDDGAGGDGASGDGADQGDAGSVDAGPQVICGGFVGTPCPLDQYCRYGADCGGTDGTGVCEEQPKICTEQMELVCGCDGVTYGNPCKAAQAAVSTVYLGACGEPLPCARCEGPAPGQPNETCPDGVHVSGPACVTGTDGTCHYAFLSCPP